MATIAKLIDDLHGLTLPDGVQESAADVLIETPDGRLLHPQAVGWDEDLYAVVIGTSEATDA